MGAIESVFSSKEQREREEWVEHRELEEATDCVARHACETSASPHIGSHRSGASRSRTFARKGVVASDGHLNVEAQQSGARSTTSEMLNKGHTSSAIRQSLDFPGAHLL